MATHWVCGEFHAEPCESVETMAQEEIGGLNCLAIILLRDCCQSNNLCRHTNMVAKIDIDAFKIKKKSRTNEAETQQKMKSSQSQPKIYWF